MLSVEDSWKRLRHKGIINGDRDPRFLANKYCILIKMLIDNYKY